MIMINEKYIENPIKIKVAKITRTLKMFPISKEEIREMSDMLNQLAERDSKAYTSENLKSLMRLARMYFAYKKELRLNKRAMIERDYFGHLEWLYFNAFEISDYLIEHGNKFHYNTKAIALERLAEIYSAMEEEGFAMWAYEELLTVYQQLGEKRNLNKYKYATARVLLNISRLYELKGDINTASKKCSEAKKIIKELFEQNPGVKRFANLLDYAHRYSQHLAYSRFYNEAFRAE